MGIGDPYHKHPLTQVFRIWSSSNCFHCELPVNAYTCYGCKDCNYYIHSFCQDLPIKLRLPLHDQHLLTLFEPPPNSSSSSDLPNLCNKCQNPCLGRFAYHCTTCQFYFHLKCLFTLDHEKHPHPLIFCDMEFGKYKNDSCNICGSDIYGFAFGCWRCEFYIHHECSLIPLEVKHHHVHKLTLRHNFPEECDQVYCDLCEDRDGEMDRELSYYYCRRCDYIAHVNCCIIQPSVDVLLCQRFTHEHPLRPHKTEPLLSCSQCSYAVIDTTLEYPSLVKHPRHPHHTFIVDSERSDNFNCTECHFAMDEAEFVKFTHPFWRYKLQFRCESSLFRCEACGELEKGSRVEYCGSKYGEFGLHLECFSLPGKLEHDSHPNHPLYLRWLDVSTSRCCSFCTKEMDPQLWFYYCQECNYAAHMDCVARELLSILRSSIKNQPDYCAIIEPDKSMFKYQIADMRPPREPRPSYKDFPAVLEVDGYDSERNCDLGIDIDGHVLACPKCSSVIPSQASHSTIRGWKSYFFKNSTIAANDQTYSEPEPLSLLDEQLIEELCCSICNISIFPPTYSCASCQIYFHKSCAELPRKILFNDTTYVLMAPPFPEDLSHCNYCKYPVNTWAYLSLVNKIIFDVQCASRTPLVNPTYHNHGLSLFRLNISNYYSCDACGNKLQNIFVMACEDCIFMLHPECGLLPPLIKHRIHQHPLELATDLSELYDEHVCDVCEKDLNPNLWAYRCIDECGIRATSHVSCVITSKKKSHFSYDRECENMTEEEKLEFRRKAKERGIKL